MRLASSKLVKLCCQAYSSLQAPKKTFNNTVLFRRVRGDKLLYRFIVTACFTQTPALGHQAVITEDNGYSFVRAQRAETFEAGIFKRPPGFSGPSSKGEPETDPFTAAAVDDSSEVSPSINTAREYASAQPPNAHCSCWPGCSLAAARLNHWLAVTLHFLTCQPLTVTVQ